MEDGENTVTSKTWLMLLVMQQNEDNQSDCNIQPEEYFTQCEECDTTVLTETIEKHFPVRKCLYLPETKMTEISVQQVRDLVHDHGSTVVEEGFTTSQGNGHLVHDHCVINKGLTT